MARTNNGKGASWEQLGILPGVSGLPAHLSEHMVGSFGLCPKGKHGGIHVAGTTESSLGSCDA